MSKKINKFKVTPGIDKELKDMAVTLPIITLLNPAGKPLHEYQDVLTPWEGLTGEDLKKYPQKQYRDVYKYVGKIKIPTGKKEEIKYYIRVARPRIENHYINLIEAYKKEGVPGIEAYVAKVNKITEASVAEALQHAKFTDKNLGEPVGQI